MILNTLFIPVTSTASAVNFIEDLKKRTPDSWSDMFAGNLMSQQYFYIKFIIQLSLVTNGISLLDGSHRIMAWLKKWCHNRRQRNSDYKVVWEDDYEF